VARLLARPLLALSLGLLLVVAGCGNDAGKATLGSSSATSNLTCARSGPCDPAETARYGTCIESACDAEYAKCFGPTYASGAFGGPCGAYYGCLARCACDDDACRSKCGVASAECQLCIGRGITPCAAGSGCKEPSCTTGPVKPRATCDDLSKCCAAITDATYRPLCATELAQSKLYGDAICGSFVKGFRQLGQCP
jgi:hypothetical protein